MTKRLEIFAGPLLGLALAFIIASLFDTTDMRDPIRGVMFTEALNSPVIAGERLEVRVTRDKVRGDCPVVSLPYFVSVDGKRVAGFPAIASGGAVDAEFVDVRYRTPDSLSPGAWALHDELTYVCPGLEPFKHTQEPVRFYVQNGEVN